ncbi:hypothetical protein MIND_00243700 [Mycena indigotica]|uniref:Uncharacterized protein n=1 Tax=Mycena indigotica TaxID=2126181 RepID=A0A8H6T8I7_9AGAR|nr:uncharacterized protein MIND_00243700 [Mycena indigotica]KAF7312307.1 hypothetical protein MIND_00243700 [Mycena indigotica]
MASVDVDVSSVALVPLDDAKHDLEDALLSFKPANGGIGATEAVENFVDDASNNGGAPPVESIKGFEPPSILVDDSTIYDAKPVAEELKVTDITSSEATTEEQVQSDLGYSHGEAVDETRHSEIPRPWTPSYSVTTQGPGTPQTEEVVEPTVAVSEVETGVTEQSSADEISRPKSPWTPSYSVVTQGSPNIPPIQLTSTTAQQPDIDSSETASPNASLVPEETLSAVTAEPERPKSPAVILSTDDVAIEEPAVHEDATPADESLDSTEAVMTSQEEAVDAQPIQDEGPFEETIPVEVVEPTPTQELDEHHVEPVLDEHESGHAGESSMDTTTSTIFEVADVLVDSNKAEIVTTKDDPEDEDTLGAAEPTSAMTEHSTPSQTATTQSEEDLTPGTITSFIEEEAPDQAKPSDVTDVDPESLAPAVDEIIERPTSPWTPSYSVTSQGPGIEHVEDIVELPFVEPIVTVSEVTVEPTDASQNPDIARPWTPSYSVVVQGSPNIPSVELHAQADEVDMPSAVDEQLIPSASNEHVPEEVEASHEPQAEPELVLDAAELTDANPESSLEAVDIETPELEVDAAVVVAPTEIVSATEDDLASTVEDLGVENREQAIAQVESSQLVDQPSPSGGDAEEKEGAEPTEDQDQIVAGEVIPAAEDVQVEESVAQAELSQEEAAVISTEEEGEQNEGKEEAEPSEDQPVAAEVIQAAEDVEVDEQPVAQGELSQDEAAIISTEKPSVGEVGLAEVGENVAQVESSQDDSLKHATAPSTDSEDKAVEDRPAVEEAATTESLVTLEAVDDTGSTADAEADLSEIGLVVDAEESVQVTAEAKEQPLVEAEQSQGNLNVDETDPAAEVEQDNQADSAEDEQVVEGAVPAVEDLIVDEGELPIAQAEVSSNEAILEADTVVEDISVQESEEVTAPAEAQAEPIQEDSLVEDTVRIEPTVEEEVAVDIADPVAVVEPVSGESAGTATSSEADSITEERALDVDAPATQEVTVSSDPIAESELQTPQLPDAVTHPIPLETNEVAQIDEAVPDKIDEQNGTATEDIIDSSTAVVEAEVSQPDGPTADQHDLSADNTTLEITESSQNINTAIDQTLAEETSLVEQPADIYEPVIVEDQVPTVIEPSTVPAIMDESAEEASIPPTALLEIVSEAVSSVVPELETDSATSLIASQPEVIEIPLALESDEGGQVNAIHDGASQPDPTPELVSQAAETPTAADQVLDDAELVTDSTIKEQVDDSSILDMPERDTGMEVHAEEDVAVAQDTLTTPSESIERPASPWTVSYSVTTQGPGMSAVEEPEKSQEPIVVISQVAQEPDNEAPTDQADVPSRPWTPSYSVVVQGSPNVAPTELESSLDIESVQQTEPEVERSVDATVSEDTASIPIAETVAEEATIAAAAPFETEGEAQVISDNATSPDEIVEPEPPAVLRNISPAVHIEENAVALSTSDKPATLDDLATTQEALSVGPSEVKDIERPKSPWTPSYSVVTQGPGVEAVEAAEPAEPVPDVQPTLTFSDAPDEKEAEAEIVETPRPKSPWTPSYSVVVQGSPSAPPIELEAEQAKPEIVDLSTLRDPDIDEHSGSPDFASDAVVAALVESGIVSDEPTVIKSESDFTAAETPTRPLTPQVIATLETPSESQPVESPAKSADSTNQHTPLASAQPLPELQAFPSSADGAGDADGEEEDLAPPLSPRSRLESTTSSLFFPGGWFSRAPDENLRPSLEVAAGEFTPSKSSPPVLSSPQPEETTQTEEKKGRWCIVM